MIDVNGEQLLTFSQLAKKIPRRRKGRPVHPATIHRWRCTGLRGVRLEAIRVGGSWVTSEEAFQLFCDRLSQIECADEKDTPLTSIPQSHQKEIEEQLDEIGFATK